MRSSYKRIGQFVRQINNRNTGLEVVDLKGISINKLFMPSVANINGTDLSKYKVVSKYQFAYNPMHVGRDEVLPICMLEADEPIIVSPAYVVFEIVDTEALLPDYLMMWCRRSEFDRNAWFTTDSSVRGGFIWDDFCDMTLPVPHPDKQREIVHEYNTIVERIKLNERINAELEDLVKDQFNDVFSDSLSLEESELVDSANTLDELIEFNPSESVSKGALTSYIEMADIQEAHMTVTGKIIREFTSGSKFRNGDTLLARITPCMENGKTAFINCLNNNEVAYGSTEFIVMRPTKKCNPYWVYCLARHDFFRSYAISSMGGSDGRQRVQSDYLKVFPIGYIQEQQVEYFGQIAEPIFQFIQLKAVENQSLKMLKDTVLSKMAA